MVEDLKKSDLYDNTLICFNADVRHLIRISYLMCRSGVDKYAFALRYAAVEWWSIANRQ